ncbi:MAG: hypothetical protein IKB01_07670, partial [Lachnospiraceae bacterium]|nr:hypothetical protein [Lachnospiraceae bacterium]
MIKGKIISIVFVITAFILTFGSTIPYVEASGMSNMECSVNRITDKYVLDYPEDKEIIENIALEITCDEEFISIYKEEPEVALEIIEDAIMDYLTPSVSNYALNNAIFFLDYSVPVVNQLCYNPSTGSALYTYCGAAATIQALIGNGLLSNTSANTDSTAVYNMGIELGTNSNGTTIGSITSKMKSYYASGSATYKTKAFTVYSYDKALYYIQYSLYHGKAPIMRVKETSDLDYYGTTDLTHYVTITKVNMNDSTITIVDPNYNASYRGEHVISMTEFEEIMKSSGFISVYTADTSDNAYEYE